MLQKIVERGTARDSTVDLKSPQTRTVSDTPFAPVHGAVRQQDPNLLKAKLPASTSKDEGEPVRQP
jgi:hypothetical protein